MRILDFHTHLQTHWFDKPLLDEAQFLAVMDKCAVETSCIFAMRGFYGDCPRENDTLAEYSHRLPKAINSIRHR